ncbi:AbrB/MazE/SpoVT family DNA-binding domain-containing protein [Bacillus pseudomycoides]|uniref:AbrB/MazE/SpoVT family DNA-binding domain-containing protein n=1 Tax=Bacillus pseudomycoides TaxID=64104 RepID=UPI000BF23BF1|nr:AbrB/MazE/SpoVT family DNA-binding domain-containing protein [Bacillus pseudomycoides]PEN08571.1 AbrB family transcriptional regulator [Bacillus pseudomycoides]
MKATGIVRHVDPLGRVVLPKELRDIMEIKDKTPLEIYTDKDSIILKKYNASNTCMLTGNMAKNPCILADGKIVLSPEGIELLLQEIRQKLNSPVGV